MDPLPYAATLWRHVETLLYREGISRSFGSFRSVKASRANNRSEHRVER